MFVTRDAEEAEWLRLHKMPVYQWTPGVWMAPNPRQQAEVLVAIWRELDAGERARAVRVADKWEVFGPPRVTPGPSTFWRGRTIPSPIRVEMDRDGVPVNLIDNDEDDSTRLPALTHWAAQQPPRELQMVETLACGWGKGRRAADAPCSSAEGERDAFDVTPTPAIRERARRIVHQARRAVECMQARGYQGTECATCPRPCQARRRHTSEQRPDCPAIATVQLLQDLDEWPDEAGEATIRAVDALWPRGLRQALLLTRRERLSHRGRRPAAAAA